MKGAGDEQPTQFEVITAAAFWLFKKKGVEYAVIEVGLGGLLDSTNVIVPEVSVITNVTFEHGDKCGGTLEGVAKHKAGIIKEGVPVVTGAAGMPLDIIKKTAQEKQISENREQVRIDKKYEKIIAPSSKIFYASIVLFNILTLVIAVLYLNSKQTVEDIRIVFEAFDYKLSDVLKQYFDV